MFELVQVIVWIGYGLYLFMANNMELISGQGALYFLLGPPIVGYVLAIPIEIAILRILELFPRDTPGFFGWHVLTALVVAVIMTRIGFFLITLI